MPDDFTGINGLQNLKKQFVLKFFNNCLILIIIVSFREL